MTERERTLVILIKIGEPIHVQRDKALKKDVTGTSRNNNKTNKSKTTSSQKTFILGDTLKSNNKNCSSHI